MCDSVQGVYLRTNIAGEQLNVWYSITYDIKYITAEE